MKKKLKKFIPITIKIFLKKIEVANQAALPKNEFAQMSELTDELFPMRKICPKGRGMPGKDKQNVSTINFNTLTEMFDSNFIVKTKNNASNLKNATREKIVFVLFCCENK